MKEGPWKKQRRGLIPPADLLEAETRMSGGVGGSRRAITRDPTDPRMGKRFAPGRALPR